MVGTAVNVAEGAFGYKGKIYPYFSDAYNSTRINERAVEVPIALDLLNNAERPLEVGAVLPHYIPNWGENGHQCIDLYEQFPGVINADVLNYVPGFKLDLIICISTLDHLNNANEVKEAVRRMKSWLSYHGTLLVTLPANQPSEIGGGAWLDDLVLSGGLDMKIIRMDKVRPHQHGWQQVPLMDTPTKAYGTPTPMANTVYILEWKR